MAAKNKIHGRTKKFLRYLKYYACKYHTLIEAYYRQYGVKTLRRKYDDSIFVGYCEGIVRRLEGIEPNRPTIDILENIIDGKMWELTFWDYKKLYDGLIEFDKEQKFI